MRTASICYNNNTARPTYLSDTQSCCASSILYLTRSRPSNNLLDKMSKIINTDLFSLTYGSIITQLLNDCEDIGEVNKQLDRMGYNIGLRLIEDYLAKTSAPRCKDFKEIAEKIQHAFHLYLNVTPSIEWSQSNDEFSIMLQSNPLTEFVELPDSLQGMSYLNILPGIIRGALEMISVPVRAWIKSDYLKGDNETEIKIQAINKD